MDVQIYDDMPCMDLVDAKYEDIENEEQMAQTRENINHENQDHSQGLIYFDQQTEDGSDDIYDEDDIIIREMVYNFLDTKDDDFYRK